MDKREEIIRERNRIHREISDLEDEIGELEDRLTALQLQCSHEWKVWLGYRKVEVCKICGLTRHGQEERTPAGEEAGTAG